MCEYVFAVVNPYQNQERIAKDHRENILYALRRLKDARTGEITKFVNDKVKLEVEEKYNSSDYLSEEPKQMKAKKRIELKQKRLDRKTVQKWLKYLEKQNLVSQTKYYVYSLTADGHSEKIFGENYGKELFRSIANLPLHGTPDDKILECIKRIGTFISFIFIRNSIQSPIGNKMEWIADAVNPQIMFEWFISEFQAFTNFNFQSQFAEYINILKNAETNYNTKTMPNLYKERIEALNIEVEELKKKLGE